jgi:hypothetical protein
MEHHMSYGLDAQALSQSVGNANIFINPGFEVWQRGVSFTNPANGAYLADKYYASTNEATGVVVTKETSIVDNGASMKIVVSSAGASTQWRLFQNIDNPEFYRGKTVSLSARVLTSVANAFKVGLYDDGVGGIRSNYHSGSGQWETLTVTATLTTGLSSLGSYLGMWDLGDKKIGTYYIDSIMLVVGSQPVPFVPMKFSDDLARCRRYFQIYGGVVSEILGTSQVTSASAGYVPFRFQTQMSAGPAMTVNNPTHFNVQNATGSGVAVGSMSANVATKDGCYLLFSGASGLVAGNATVLLCGNTDATISAEIA